MSENPFEIPLPDALNEPALNDLITEISEKILDDCLDEEVLREIPFVKTVVNIIKSKRAIGNYFFVKKFLGFLKQCGDLPIEDRQKFVIKNFKDKEAQEKTQETIYLILDHLDNLEKPELIGKCFKAWVLGEIDFAQFQRLAWCIERAHISDLKEVPGFSGTCTPPKIIGEGLTNAGILKQELGTMDSIGAGLYEMTEIGRLLQKILIKENCYMNRGSLF